MQPKRRLMPFAILLAASGLFAGCGPNNSDADGSPDGGTSRRDTGWDDNLDFGDGGTPTYPDVGYHLNPDAACSSASAQAVLVYEPVDIILAVDNSSSMKEEVTNTNANLNELGQVLEQSDIDYHVVMISKRGTHISTYPYEVCIPPPLAGANCADGPRFKHVDEEIYSTKPLKQVWQTYQGIHQTSTSATTSMPELSWKSFLRPESRKHFLVITDDNSTASQTDGVAFDQKILSFDPPMFQGYVFNAICGLDATSCPTIDGVGDSYIYLANKTGGELASICDTDWRALFQNLAKSVVKSTKLSCDFDIPPAPPGKTLAAAKVSVIYTPGGGGAPVEMVRVDSAAACSTTPGFYFDSNTAPRKIIICAQTCPTLQGDASGRVDVMFGCKSDIN